ncbi:MAG TPA: deoxyhypusine synthase family protein [Vicinamibacteria bacterium]|nr:deoxyhypusine synthase family protein [Vicinamibacteria bacterium]
MTEARTFHDGRHDGLVALESLDLDRVRSFPDLLRAMSRTAFSGRSLGEAFEVTLAMVEDPGCKVVMTLSGAMTIAKMGKVISKMIDTGMVQAIVSTGALMAHGLSEAVGLVHYRHDPSMSDEELFEKGYNRVYDTLEMEANLNYVEEFSRRALEVLGDQELSSEIVCRALGKVLAKDGRGSGVLRSAYEQGVPVYVPAFTDSELGLDLATWTMQRAQATGITEAMDLFGSLPRFNPYLDLNSFARLALGAERLGIFTIGGGVPRNWAQEVGPYVDVMNHRLGTHLRPPRYRYAVRICPEPTHWGGLSGCTYSEGVSWGKFVPEAEGGRFAEVYADATTVWPLLIKGVLDERARRAADPSHAREDAARPAAGVAHGRLQEPRGPHAAPVGAGAARQASGRPRKVKAKPRP